MLNRIARVLMNEADASPGGGAPAPTPEATEGQAQAPSVSPDAVVEAVTRILDQKLVDLKNSTEANVRRMIDGALGKKKNGNSAPAPKPDKDAAPEPTTPTQPQTADMRTFDRAVRRLDLSDAALARMERAYVADAPDDAGEWVKSYLSDLGIKNDSDAASKAASATPTATATQTATVVGAAPKPAAPPQNDPGAPQGLPVWERPSNPFQWTEEDIARLQAQKGVRESQRIIRRKAEEFARTIRLELPNKR